MNNLYKNIFSVALSAIPLEKKVRFLERNWNRVNEKELFKLAKRDEVASHIAYIVTNSSIAHDSVWEAEYQSIYNRINTLMNELENIAHLLNKNGIKIVALKNAGITKGIYQNFGCSPMGDIDLLVKSKDFEKAHYLIVENLNYTFKFRSKYEKENLEEAFRGGGTEYYKFVGDLKVWLELQWRPIAGRWIQPHNEPKGDLLMDNSIEIEDSYVRILAPEDNLLQVTLHTAKHSYVRAPGFRLHSDVDRIVRFQKIDWDKFTETVIHLKLKTSVFFSLYFASDLLQTPIPKDVLRKLKPDWYRRQIINYYIKKAGFFNQRKKKFTKLGYIIFNLALYDSLSENFKAVFPPFESLKIKYDIQHKWQMPYYHIKRIKDLTFKRAKL